MSGRLTHLIIRTLDATASLLGVRSKIPQHLRTGVRGEEEAYFHLRRLGYVMVARNFRSPRRRGEIDLIAWEGNVLCFIEVKTRTTRAVKPAEAAVDYAKQHDLRGVADEYIRRLPDHAKDEPLAHRFDVVSVYYEPAAATEITLFRNAFSVS
jgi:putative endonuclease